MRRASPAGIIAVGKEGRRVMPTYVVLVNWTDQGMTNVKETIHRTEQGAELAKKKWGAEFKAYWTVGPYDMVSIFEAPDEETLSAHLLEICSAGNIRTTTMRAYDRQEMSAILQRLD
jgi:uncharacterized protein with GYD domain